MEGLPARAALLHSGRVLQHSRASFALGENAPNGCDKTLEFDRFGVELIAPRRECLFALAGERMRGEGDNGDVAGLRIALEPPRSLPAVDDGHFEVHQDNVRPLGSGHLASFLAVLRRQHLEIAEQLEPHLEHEDVVVVVFDVEQFGHDAASISLLTAGFLCTSRRMRSTRSAGWNCSLTSTHWTPAFNRSRSLASRSRAVMTMTGMSRQPVSFCRAATTAKPSISGIIRSSRITSGLLSCIRLSASRPFAASRTVHCGPSSHPRIRSRWTASSSTSRTRVGGTGARNRLTSRCSRSWSIGLVRYPAAPSAMPRRYSSTIVIMMTGMSASSGSCRKAANTDQPSRSGIITSSVIAVGRNSLASFSPSTPPAAVATENPSALR